MADGKASRQVEKNVRRTYWSTTTLAMTFFSSAMFVGALAGCELKNQTIVNRQDSDQPIVTSLGPGDAMPSTLQQLAQQEASASSLVPLDVPAPPGVEPDLLAERRLGRALSQLSLHEALELLIDADGSSEAGAQTSDAAGIASRDIDARDQDQALREYAKGRDDAIQRRHLSAVTHFLKAIELSPGNVSVLRGLARSYLGLGNQTKALQTYEQVLRVQPSDSEAAFMAALAAADKRDFDTAARLLGRKIARGETFTHDGGAAILAKFVLGVSLAHLGYDAASIEVTKKVLSLIDGTPVPSMYSARLGSLYRQRGELWRSIGDAYSRQGKYELALEAYDHSAALPMPDPFALAPRVLYANLRLGRVRHAQLELYAALAAEAPNVSERLIGLCTYMREYGGSLNALAQAIVELQRQYPSDPTLVRTAAALLDDAQATALLREYVTRQPDNIDVIGELLRWLAASDVTLAVELATEIIGQRPALTNAVAQQLFLAVGRPGDIVRAARELPDTAETALVQGRVLMMMGGLGRAWQVLDEASARWPMYAPLHQTRMELAASLDEPGLLKQLIADWSGEKDGPTLLAESRALRRAGLGDLAVAAAERAAHVFGEDAETLTELAWAHLSLGLVEDTEDRVPLHGQDAAQYAQQAIGMNAAYEPAYRVLATVYGPGGPLADPAKLRDVARRLFHENPDSRLYLQLVVEEALSRRRYEQALEQALHLYDTLLSDTASLKMAVSAWRNMDRLEDSARWLKRKLDDRPGDPNLLEQWATVQLMMNRVDVAIAHLEQQVADDPLDYAALRLLESTYQAAGQLDRAIDLGEQRLLGRPAGIRRELELASLYAGTGRTTEAMERLELIVQQCDEATRGQLIGATSIAARIDDAMPGRNDMIVALVEAAAARFDDLPLEMYSPVLLIKAAHNESSGIFESFAKSVARDVSSYDGGGEQAAMRWQRVAQQLVDAGYPGAAAVVVQARVLAQPGMANDRAHAVLCLVTFTAQAAAGGQAQRSIDLLRELRQRGRLPLWPAVTGQPTLAESLYELSQMYNILGDEDGSLTIMRELIGLQPQHAMTLNNLGYMLIERGDHDERTVRMIELAHKLEPDEPNILDTIGWLRYKQGIFDVVAADGAGVGEQPIADSALGYITRAEDVDTQPSPEALDHLGDVLWRIGRADEAVKTWQKVIELLSDQREVRETKEIYQMLQERVWWLVVVDVETIYERTWGVILQRTQEKLNAVERGAPPPVAPTFEELE